MRGRMPYRTRFGDGAEFAVEDVRAARRAQWAHAVSFDYEAGDVLIVDNYRTMHSRDARALLLRRLRAAPRPVYHHSWLDTRTTGGRGLPPGSLREGRVGLGGPRVALDEEVLLGDGL